MSMRALLFGGKCGTGAVGNSKAARIYTWKKYCKHKYDMFETQHHLVGELAVVTTQTYHTQEGIKFLRISHTCVRENKTPQQFMLLLQLSILAPTINTQANIEDMYHSIMHSRATLDEFPRN